MITGDARVDAARMWRAKAKEEPEMKQGRSSRGGIRRAFTLVELIAVMVVLAVLAGVAIPKYFDYSDRAKASAIEGSLGGVRTGLANFYSNTAIEGDGKYPEFVEFTTIGTVMQEDVPTNPFNGMGDIQRITNFEDATNRIVKNPTKFGWNYYVNNKSTPPVAIFWCNSEEETSVLKQNGKPYKANEL